jgi:hypothetical protein
MDTASALTEIARLVAEAHRLAIEIYPHDATDARYERLLDLLFDAEKALQTLTELQRPERADSSGASPVPGTASG